jgi:hypothetical protein
MTTYIAQYDHDHQRFRRPSDGQLVPLVIQSFDDICSLPPTTQWTRLGKPLNQIPLLQRVSYWVLSPILEDGSGRRRITLGTAGASLMRVVGACPLLLISVRVLARLQSWHFVTNFLKMSTPDFDIGTFKFMLAVPKVDTDLRYLPVVCDHR